MGGKGKTLPSSKVSSIAIVYFFIKKLFQNFISMQQIFKNPINKRSVNFLFSCQTVMNYEHTSLFRPRHMVGTLEVIVQEASKVKIVLPNVSALKEALHRAKEWTNKVEQVQVIHPALLKILISTNVFIIIMNLLLLFIRFILKRKKNSTKTIYFNIKGV